MPSKHSSLLTEATYAYPGAPACLTSRMHTCVYVNAAQEVHTHVSFREMDRGWHMCGDETVEEATARFETNSVFFSKKPKPKQKEAADGNNHDDDDDNDASKEEEEQAHCKKQKVKKKKSVTIIACLSCTKRCSVYADNYRTYPLINPVTGKPSSLHSEMALVCLTCAFPPETPLSKAMATYNSKTIYSSTKQDVKNNNVFFFCPQCTAHTHAGLAAAKR